MTEEPLQTVELTAESKEALSKYVRHVPPGHKDVYAADYYGTKRVTAWPERGRVAEGFTGTAGEGNLQPAYPEGYAVRYADGYTSWSPKEAFEAAYMPIDAMDFGRALHAMREGERVARTGWNGKGMWLVLVPGDAWNVDDVSGERIELVALRRLPFICMKTADDKFVPWLASQTDMLALDWRIVT